jgi:RNA polymerase sigma factor (sigma-70 family)
MRIVDQESLAPSQRVLLEKAYRRYMRFWVNLAKTVHVEEEDARDIVHGVLSTIIRRGDLDFASVEHVRNYVSRAVINRSVQARVRGERHASWSDALENTLRDPELQDAMEHEEFSRVLAEVLCALPDRSFEIIKMRFYCGYTFQEISRLLGISISTLKSREDAAVRAVRAALRRRGYP